MKIFLRRKLCLILLRDEEREKKLETDAKRRLSSSLPLRLFFLVRSGDILAAPLDQFGDRRGKDPVWSKKSDERMVWVSSFLSSFSFSHPSSSLSSLSSSFLPLPLLTVRILFLLSEDQPQESITPQPTPGVPPIDLVSRSSPTTTPPPTKWSSSHPTSIPSPVEQPCAKLSSLPLPREPRERTRRRRRREIWKVGTSGSSTSSLRDGRSSARVEREIRRGREHQGRVRR